MQISLAVHDTYRDRSEPMDVAALELSEETENSEDRDELPLHDEVNLCSRVS